MHKKPTITIRRNKGWCAYDENRKLIYGADGWDLRERLLQYLVMKGYHETHKIRYE